MSTSKSAWLINCLRRLNRKERFILLNEVCGTFRIDPDFARRLEKELELECAIPCDAFVAMDYHLDWLQIALHLAESGTLENDHLRNSTGREPEVKLFEGNQQDIDMLIAFSYNDFAHLILVEAKADTAWNRKQLQYKVERIVQILGKGGDNYSVCPYFVLMSPKDPREGQGRLMSVVEEWPKWMRRDQGPHWLHLQLGENRLRVKRIAKDSEQLRFSEWSEKDRKWKGLDNLRRQL